VTSSDDLRRNSSFDKQQIAPEPFSSVAVLLQGTITDGTVAGTATLIPEPATLLLMGAGVAGLIPVVRRGVPDKRRKVL
jgi:hypothetical protein